ncbi:hypothetical protein VCUG_01472 [Vavraia culicis subsp. floridensis]|uniref:Uncharacterized protein n=1 Tax=Vavraia culicis (isolate floridensis) TaxID=948595 RepID=L2GUJ5_VAVCU|nr:uncharacterized protein VCUG_01472 [Vavraia culicis subsp. floridensis]ELA47027.1 hypothetical protein VCUG_01472 [Vavraia culicis subsp. floridensis]
MLPDLYSYVETAIKYILLFETDFGLFFDDYMIVDDLNDTGLANFLEVLSNRQPFYSFSDGTQKSISKRRSRGEMDVTGHNLHYLSRYFGVRQIEYQSYHTIINKNKNIEYKIIYVPFKQRLFKKLMKLSEQISPKFTTDEICSIFKYVFPHQDKIRWLTYAICVFLQHDLHLVCSPKVLCKQSMKHISDPHVKNLASFIFGDNDTMIMFRKAVNTSLALTLRDSCNNEAHAYGDTVLSDPIHLKVDLKKLSIGFLFHRLSMNSSFLVRNMELLQNKFQDNMARSSLSVEIHIIGNIENIPESNTHHGDQTLVNELKFILACSFLNHESINDVLLKIDNLKQEINPEIFDRIKAVKSVACKFCSVEFMRSLPKHITITSADFMQADIDKSSNIPDNVLAISYLESVFYQSISLSSTSKICKISKCIFYNNSFVSIDETCENITVKNTSTTVKLNGAFGSTEVLLEGSPFSYLKLKNKAEHNGRLLEISGAKMKGTLEITADMRIVAFIRVYLSPESKVVFHEECTYVTISESCGLFDLRRFLGTELRLNENMLVMISPIERSTQKLSSVTLCDVRFHGIVTLPNRYERVELKGVFMDNSSLIILNNACKELALIEFSGTIDIRSVDSFDSIKIHASIHARNNIKFKGIPRVRYLCWHNICSDLCILQSLAVKFRDIEHLQFVNECPLRDCGDIVGYSASTGLRFIHTNNFECLPHPLVNYTVDMGTSGHVVPSVVPDFVANLILKRILQNPANKNIKKMEIQSVAVTKENFQLFKTLPKLQILRVYAKDFSTEIFQNLPDSLKLLDISNPFVDANGFGSNHMKDNWMLAGSLKKIKILTIDANVFFGLHLAGFALSNIEVLKIRFVWFLADSILPSIKKVEPRELLIEREENLIDPRWERIEGVELGRFIDLLAKRINFPSLKYFAFVSNKELVVIDPATLTIVSRRPGTEIHHSSQVITYKEDLNFE